MGRFSLPKKKDEYKISQESADASVRDLLDYYKINLEELPDKDQRSAMEAVSAKLSIYYRMGLIENTHTGGAAGPLKVTQHLQEPPGEVRELVYNRMDGAARLATDGYSEKEQNAKAQALMAYLCGLPAEFMRSLVGNDLSAMECLSAVFRSG